MTQRSTDGLGLDAIIRLTRAISISLLMIHFYLQESVAFGYWGMNSQFTDNLARSLRQAPFFASDLRPKLGALLFLMLSLLAASGKKESDYSPAIGLRYAGLGCLFFFGSSLIHRLDFPPTHIAICYIFFCSIGYLTIMHAGNYLSRIIWNRLKTDIFNRLQESFPQEESLIANEYSVNLPARYEFKGVARDSMINIVNIFRGSMLVGNPGSMKTVGFVEPLIKQLIQKQFSMVIHDLKAPNLSKLAYYHFMKQKHLYKSQASFIHVNFDDLRLSHRGNALPPSMLKDISDATESARSILLGLNKEWVEKEGDFFVESAISFVTGLIWFLRTFQDGKYCTWPHVIELSGVPLKELFTVLQAHEEIETCVNPFVEAMHLGASDQLGGQVASAKIGFSRLSSPSLYYVLTGNDFTLDINNPKSPTILTLANNSQKSRTYGAFLSVYINTINRLANRPGMDPLALVLDECSSLFIASLEQVLASGRENKIAVFMVIQDLSQLRLTYGRRYADVLFNICGNIFCGQTSGDTATEISKRFGRIMQERESISISASDTSITQSSYLETAIPPSRIATLSSGDFVGIVADKPDQRIELKAFSARLLVDFEALSEERRQYPDLPVVRDVTREEILENYRQVKRDVEMIILSETARIRNSPDKMFLARP